MKVLKRSAAKSRVRDGWRQQGLGRPKWAVAPAWANQRESVGAVVRAAKSFQSRVDRNRQESTGIELQRVALRTRFVRLWEVADWSFAPHWHARLLSIPVDSRRFGSSRARRGVNKKRKGLMLVDQRFVLISRTSGDFAPVHGLSTHGKDARPARSPGGRPSIRGPVTP